MHFTSNFLFLKGKALCQQSEKSFYTSLPSLGDFDLSCYTLTLSIFKTICFIRISRLKFAKVEEYFKSKPEDEILKKI